MRQLSVAGPEGEGREDALLFNHKKRVPNNEARDNVRVWRRTECIHFSSRLCASIQDGCVCDLCLCYDVNVLCVCWGREWSGAWGILHE